MVCGKEGGSPHGFSEDKESQLAFPKEAELLQPGEKQTEEATLPLCGCHLHPDLGSQGLFLLHPGIPRAWQDACHKGGTQKIFAE